MAQSYDPAAQKPFLLIEQKEDTQAKLAAVAGKPTKNYLFAPELNKIVSSINKLRSLIQLTPAQIETILATGVRINLGEVGELDFLDDFINGENYGQIEYGTEGTTFIVFTKNGVKYVYTFIGEPGLYGGMYNNDGEFVVDNPMTSDDLELLYDGSFAVTLPPPAFKTWKAIFHLVGNTYFNYDTQVNTIGQIQVWGNPKNILLKYFAPGGDSYGSPWPPGTFVSYSNVCQNNLVLNYGHQVFEQNQNSSINLRCPEFDTTVLTPSTMFVEVTIPNI